MPEILIHFAEIFSVINIRGKTLAWAEEARILCGLKDGEADTRRRLVTCIDCRALLKRRGPRPLKGRSDA